MDKRKKIRNCDICGSDFKVRTKKNYPFGRNSKPIIIKLCRKCKEVKNNGKRQRGIRR